MRIIAITIMKLMLAKARKDKANKKHPIVRASYSVMIKNYEDTILYLESNK